MAVYIGYAGRAGETFHDESVHAYELVSVVGEGVGLGAVEFEDGVGAAGMVVQEYVSVEAQPQVLVSGGRVDDLRFVHPVTAGVVQLVP